MSKQRTIIRKRAINRRKYILRRQEQFTTAEAVKWARQFQTVLLPAWRRASDALSEFGTNVKYSRPPKYMVRWASAKRLYSSNFREGFVVPKLTAIVRRLIRPGTMAALALPTPQAVSLTRALFDAVELFDVEYHQQPAFSQIFRTLAEQGIHREWLLPVLKESFIRAQRGYDKCHEERTGEPKGHWSALEHAIVAGHHLPATESADLFNFVVEQTNRNTWENRDYDIIYGLYNAFALPTWEHARTMYTAIQDAEARQDFGVRIAQEMNNLPGEELEAKLEWFLAQDVCTAPYDPEDDRTRRALLDVVASCPFSNNLWAVLALFPEDEIYDALGQVGYSWFFWNAPESKFVSQTN